MTPAERSALESCPTTRLHLVPDCGHMLINQKARMGGQADHRRCRRNAVDGNELTGSLRVGLRSGEVEAGLGQEAVNETRGGTASV